MYQYRIKTITIFILCCVIPSVVSLFTNKTAIDITKCKVHYSRSESLYKKFFEITDNFRNPNDALVFDFHFAVQAPRDAHILLTPSTILSNYDPVYEIVLGAGMNTFSDIRRLQKSATKSSKTTKNVLSVLDIKPFWLHVSRDGLIEIGREGEDLAFLSWKDPSPLPLKYFSFSTYPGVEAKWYYDCLREDGTPSNSREVELKLSPTEKLKQDLLMHYDPYVKPTINPDSVIAISLIFNYDRVHLEESNSKLIVDGMMQMQWWDEKISWHPEDYNNIENLSLYYREIWQPDIILYNSASGPGTDFMKFIKLFVTSEGLVTWVVQVHMESWCDASGLGHWPNDEHSCVLQLGFWMQEKFLFFEANVNSSMSQKYISEWEVTNVEDYHYALNTPWNQDADSYSNAYNIKFTIKRSSDMYSSVYFTPLFAISISLLISFWLPIIGPYRISLYCSQLITLSFVLTKLSSMIPAHPTNVPYIVHLYGYSFIAVIVALIFAVIFKNWLYTKQTTPLPNFIYNFLNLSIVQHIVYVHDGKFSDSYDKLMENTSIKSRDMKTMWIALSVAIDRLLFIIYFFLITICLSKQY